MLNNLIDGLHSHLQFREKSGHFLSFDCQILILTTCYRHYGKPNAKWFLKCPSSLQVGYLVLPSQRLHPCLHHRAWSGCQAEWGVQQTQHQADRSVHRQPGGSLRLEQGDTRRLVKLLDHACIFDSLQQQIPMYFI